MTQRFGLYVDGLEERLLEAANIDAPTLMEGMVLLLLYADDLTLSLQKAESAARLQKQLEALESFCDQRQLTVNLSKTKVVVFEGKQSSMQDFMMIPIGALVERVDSCNYLTFVFNADENMTFGAGFLVGGCWKGIVRHAVCFVGHQGSCFAVQAI